MATLTGNSVKDTRFKVNINMTPIDGFNLGAGTYYVTLKVSIPDADFKDGIRIEKRTGSTGVTIDAR